MDQKLVTAAALTGTLEMAGHWFPWPRPLHRIGAYVYGVSAILVGVAVATERHTTARTALVCAAAGSATAAAYLIDRALKLRQRRRYGRDPRTGLSATRAGSARGAGRPGPRPTGGDYPTGAARQNR